MQRRQGPSTEGYLGLLQPIKDGIKLAPYLKGLILPNLSERLHFHIGPYLTLICSILIWISLPIPYLERNSLNWISSVDWISNSILLEYNILYILALSTINGFLLLYSGWSSHSNLSLIGIIRGLIQLISYEVSTGIQILIILYLINSFSLWDILDSQIHSYNIWFLWPSYIIFIITILAETNRPPFDLPECESELVAGYITEYSGLSFTALYLAEYMNILSMSHLTNIFFHPSIIGLLLITFIFILIRATLPRLKFIELLKLGWIEILPLIIGLLILIKSILND